MLYLTSLLILCVLFRTTASAPVAGFCKAKVRTSEERGRTKPRDGTFGAQSVNKERLNASRAHLNSSRLFGSIWNIVADPKDLKAYSHPRVLVNRKEWERILRQYTNEESLETRGTWSNHFFGSTVHKGPLSTIISHLARLYLSGATSVYDGRAYQKNSPQYESYRRQLKPLADRMQMMSPLGSVSFFMCAFWANVDELLKESILPKGTYETCIHATVAWSKILLSHRAYYCHPKCPLSQGDPNGIFIWNSKKPWDLSDDYASAASSVALAYDVMYNRMSLEERETVRSAIALLVFKRCSLGNSGFTSDKATSTNSSAVLNQIPDGWDVYRSNLYITNLAIENEDEFDAFTTDILLKGEGASTGEISGSFPFFEDTEANTTYSNFLHESTFEDGYAYFMGIRLGALGVIASHKRGSGLLDTSLFRNFIYNTAQFSEPWQCGGLMGYENGAKEELFYNIYLGLFKYIYPEGELPAMLWRQRFGSFENHSPCRTDWWQSIISLAFFGGEHTTQAKSPEGLGEKAKEQFKLSSYAPECGLMAARGSHNEQAAYVRLDARSEKFFGERSNKNRGFFTFSVLRQTWFDESSRNGVPGSREHSLVHVDGFAADDVNLSGKISRVSDNGKVFIAVADLTDSYNNQWTSELHREMTFERKARFLDETETLLQTSSRTDDESRQDRQGVTQTGSDVGLGNDFINSFVYHKIEGDKVGDSQTWRKENEKRFLSHIVRSIGLIRSKKGGPGLVFFADSINVGSGSHRFESYVILGHSIQVEYGLSFCTGNYCKVILRGKDSASVEVHVVSTSNSIGFHVENVNKGRERLVVKSEGLASEEIWMALFPKQEGCNQSFAMTPGEDYMTIDYEGSTYEFEIDDEDKGVANTGLPPMEPIILQPWIAHGMYNGKSLCITNGTFVLLQLGNIANPLLYLSSSIDG